MTAVISGSEVELGRDRDLVELHQAGDDAAFSALYALHYGRLVRFCARLTRDPHAAEEVAQEAFARAFASLDNLNGERRFYPWLTVIARRLVIDRVRDRGRYEFRADMDSGFARAAEDVAVQRMDRDHVAMAFGRLTERHQDVLRLRDWEGLSYDAIAVQLGVPTTTIAPLLHRARQSLRREYVAATRSRAASWLHLAPLFAAARRMRDRAAIWSAHLPDPSVFAAPMAGAVLGAALLLAPQAMEPTSLVDVRLGSSGSGLHVPGAAPHSGSPAGKLQSGRAQATSLRPGEKAPLGPSWKLREAGVRTEETPLRYVVATYPDTWEERREETKRMSHYYEEENTGIYIGTHPEAVTEYGLYLIGY